MNPRTALVTFVAVVLVVVALAQPVRQGAGGGATNVPATDGGPLGKQVPPVKKRRILPAPPPRTPEPVPVAQGAAGGFPGPSGQPLVGNGATKCTPTDPVNIGGHFWSDNSEYWAGQWNGWHNGTDFLADQGQPVYAPYNMLIEYLDYYGDSGRIGWYIQSRLDDQYLYYSGHLGDVFVKVGDYVPACTQIATIGVVNHTHVKIASPDKPVPCEATGCDDFEAYFETH